VTESVNDASEPPTHYDDMAEGYARFWGPVIRPAAVKVLDLVAATLDARDDAHVLDVGSGTGALAIATLETWPRHRVTGIDLAGEMLEVARRTADAQLSRHVARRFRAEVAAADRLPFEDDTFDVAFSNAVVEHVGGREEQRRFVTELCRVAPRVFVSTPNRWFPVETHTLVPLVHWLPRVGRDRVFGALRRRTWEGVELLTRRELLALFPAGVEPRVLESRITITVAATRTSK